MRWELSDEQADFRSVLRDWLQDRCASPTLRGWLDTGDPGPFEEQFAAEGWSAVGSPEELGGQGGGLVELALAAEELGRAAAPSSAWMGSVLAVPGLADSPDAAKALLADGVTTVLAVPSGAVPVVRPQVSDDGAGLTGSVGSVLGADRARRLLVPVQQPNGTALVLVDVGSARVEVRPQVLTDRTRTTGDIAFRGATGTPVAADVDAVLDQVALRAAVLTSADALGATERMLEMAVEYAKQRHQFGVPIGSFQAVKHAAAQMLVQVESARSIVYFAAASVQAGHPEAHLHAAAAKAQVTAGAAEAADMALTLHGAIGYTWEYDLQLYYKRAMLDRVLYGTPSAWNERIAAALDLVPESSTSL
jgi:alkylation response protein AidB-like acyl-CoA dehydrogenase